MNSCLLSFLAEDPWFITLLFKICKEFFFLIKIEKVKVKPKPITIGVGNYHAKNCTSG